MVVGLSERQVRKHRPLAPACGTTQFDWRSMLVHWASSVHARVQYPLPGPPPRKSFELDVKQVRPGPQSVVAAQASPM
jgi:hypothetical protein